MDNIMKYLIALILVLIPTTASAQIFENDAQYIQKYNCPIWQDCHNDVANYGEGGMAAGIIRATDGLVSSIGLQPVHGQSAAHHAQAVIPAYSSPSADPCALIPSGNFAHDGRQLMTQANPDLCNDLALSRYASAESNSTEPVAQSDQQVQQAQPIANAQPVLIPEPVEEPIGWVRWFLKWGAIIVGSMLVIDYVMKVKRKRKRQMESKIHMAGGFAA